MANYETRDVNFNDMTIGINATAEGLEQYKEDLKANLLIEVGKQIDDNYETKVIPALDKGWQGISRERFEINFKKMRELVKSDLQAEYDNLIARIDELAYNFQKQDENMIDEI